jgi:transposase
MISLPRGLVVYAYGDPCDMRKSFATLSALVTEGMKRDVLSGDLFLFVSRDRKRTKVLYYDGTGLCLFAKRLDRGHFVAVWKRHRRTALLELTLSELALFVEGSPALHQSLSPALIRRADLQVKVIET